MIPEQFQNAYDILPEPTLLLTPQGTVLAANRAVEERLGISRNGLRGRRLSEIVADPAAKVAECLRAWSRNRSLVLGALTFSKPDGILVPCRCEGAFLSPSDQTEGGRILLRLLLKESAARQFLVLNEKIEELTSEVRKRKLAEQEAHQQREWLQVTLASIGDAVITTDAEGCVTFLNPVAQALTGWTQTDAAGLPLEQVFRIVNEHSRKSVENPVSRVLHEGVVAGLANHTVLIAKDRAERPIDDSAAPIRDAEGRVAGAILVFRDVTERKKAEQALARMAAIVESSDDVIISKTLDGIIRSWNQGAERVFGYTASEVVGRPITLLVPPDRPGEEEGILQRLQRGERIDHFETIRVRKDGRRVQVSVTISPVRDSQGVIIGASKIARDITEQKQREQGIRFLAEASASLATLVDYESTLQKVARLAVPGFADWCAVDLAAADGALQRLIVVHADPAKIELARRLSQHYPPDPNADRGSGHVFRTGKSDLMTDITDAMLMEAAKDEEHLRLLRHLGLKSYLSVPLRAATKMLGVLTFAAGESARRFTEVDREVAEDLAHRAAIAIENARLYQELRDADRRKDEFLAMLAHELRNPLAPIRNAVQIMRMIGLTDPNLHRSREMIERQVQHLTRLVDDLLEVSRITSGKIKLQRERVDLATAIARAVETSQPLVDARHQKLQVRLPPEALQVEGDATRLAQLFGNLLNNAAKYMQEGGSIRLTAWWEGEYAVVGVRDEGMGIAAELLPRIFDLFTQADRSLDRSEGGLGIGLNLARRLVEMHGGTITATSGGVGKGSEFTVRLPLLQQAPASAMTETPSPEVMTPNRTCRVLVVDDNQDSADSIALLLKLQGYQVLTVYEGRAALAATRNFEPEVVLLDIGLPGMSGYDVARQLRSNFKDRRLRIVAMTGYGQDEDRRRSQQAGFDYHLTKPVDPDKLHQVLLENPCLDE